MTGAQPVRHANPTALFHFFNIISLLFCFSSSVGFYLGCRSHFSLTKVLVFVVQSSPTFFVNEQRRVFPKRLGAVVTSFFFVSMTNSGGCGSTLAAKQQCWLNPQCSTTFTFFFSYHHIDQQSGCWVEWVPQRLSSDVIGVMAVPLSEFHSLPSFFFLIR